MKKMLALLMLILCTAVLSLTGSAHGGNHKPVGERGYPRPDLCSVYDCNLRGTHQHGTSWYRGHYIEDEHEWHEICNDTGCTVTGLHEHDGTSFFCSRSELDQIRHS